MPEEARAVVLHCPYYGAHNLLEKYPRDDSPLLVRRPRDYRGENSEMMVAINGLRIAMKVNSEELMSKNIRFKTFGLCGCETACRIWKGYFGTADGIIPLVDAAGRSYFPEAREEMDSLLNEQTLLNVNFGVTLVCTAMLHSVKTQSQDHLA